MTTLPRPATPDGLFLWVMHRFAEVFEDHAIIKGGMALRLMDCPRSTTDIDYVFVPYRSKNDVRARIESVLAEIPFTTNKQELQLLKTPNYKQKIAEALEAAVLRYRRSLKGASTVASQ